MAIGAAAVGPGGREGDIFRKASGGASRLLVIAVLALLQSSGALSWMVAVGKRMRG